MKRLIFLFFIVISFQLFSQSNYIDSLEQSIISLPKNKQIEIVLAIPYDKIVANTTKAEELYLKLLDQAISIKNQEYIADIYSQLSLVNYFLGNNEKRLDFKLKAIKIYEASNNISKAGSAYSDLGFSMKRGNIEKAKSYMQKAIHLLEKEKDSLSLNAVYDNYGSVQKMAGNIDSSIFYHNLALDLKRKQSDSIGIPFALSHLSEAYLIKKDYKKAKKYLDESYIIRKNRNDIYGIAESLAYYGDYYYAQENYKQAIIFFNDCYTLAIKNEYIHLAQYAADYLSISYEKTGDINNTVKFLRIQQSLKDSLLNQNTNQTIAKLEIQFETEKKEKEIKLLNTENELKIRDANEKKFQRNLSLIGLGLFILLAIYIFFQLINKKKINKLLEFKNLEITNQKEIIEEKNTDITASIRYAKRIQNAILPQPKFVNQFLPNSFVFYQPKDIVAGDFYWMETVSSEKNEDDLIILAVADCTGHGVPGAMVSVVCSNALNRATREFKLTDPAKILNKTRDLVIETFEKSDEDVKDGMDISLCCMNIPRNNSTEIATLEWAGANNPLWIIRNNELLEFKPDKQPIGKSEQKNPFTTHNIELQMGDSLYILTDGYPDQFGGEKGKKFKYKPLKELLISIQNFTMDKQKLALETHFKNWKGDLEQVDDVCIIGVRI